MDDTTPRTSCSSAKLVSLRLSVLKLDGSCFDIEVAETATVGELKQAIEGVFTNTPQGPSEISWPHVWGNFCLSYGSHKLVVETDSLQQYGIQDGDQLHFTHYDPNTCNMKKNRQDKYEVDPIKYRASDFDVRSSHQHEEYKDDAHYGVEMENHQNYDKEDEDDDGIGTDNDIEKGKLKNYDDIDDDDGTFTSKIVIALLGIIRMIKKIFCLCRRKRYSQRDAPLEREMMLQKMNQ